MRKLLLAFFVTILIVCPCANARSSYTPNLGDMQLVAQLPAEAPQRILGLAYDGEKLWTSIYLSRGRYATLDPATLEWKLSNEENHHKAISEVSGAFQAGGALCFVNGKLWVAGFYGESLGSIDMTDWKVEHVFKGKQVEGRGSQSYSSMAYDGNNLWIAWHWFRYDLPTSQTQLLLKIDPATGKVLAHFPLPRGTRADGTHALTFAASMLWHAEDNRLSSIDPATGRVTGEYKLDQLKRPSGLAYDGSALWIAEFDGKIWRLPLYAAG